MFIYAEQPFPVRVRVRIFLEVHGCPLLLGDGEVRWARSAAFTSYPWCPGFGVRFASLPARSRALVRRLVTAAPKLARGAPSPAVQGSACNPP